MTSTPETAEAESSTVTVAELRSHLKDIMDRVSATHRRVVVTRHGAPEFVLMALADLEALEETLDIMGDPQEMAALREGIAAADAGELYTLDEVRADLAARRT